MINTQHDGLETSSTLLDIDVLSGDRVWGVGFSGLVLTNSILLGDVNGDGQINLLDVQPFVDLLTSGDFQAEADINQDGAVNLLDIAGFVGLLSGG